ncbi:hypothetical protein E2R56_05675 [Rhodococcus qingshengii]|nr:hypothetical protein E2R56_05675 [Rhodococcus qingshengii]
MVIQSNMSPKAIVEIWEVTATIFKKHNVPLTEKALETFLEAYMLENLLIELNFMVGSSTTTCIEGG